MRKQTTHSQGRLHHIEAVHNGKNRALVYRWSISGWWQRDITKVWLSLTHERCSGYYRNTSYLGWWLILMWLPRRGDNWADPGEWGYLPYMDLLLYFLDQRVFRRITESSFCLKHQSSSVSPTVHPHHLPLELWYMPRGDMEMCCPDLPSGTHCPAAGSAASGKP